MASNLPERIAQARQRLNTALIAGEDTSTHRAALEALEATHEAERANERAEADKASQARREGITAAAHLLADAAWLETTASVAALAIPTRPAELDMDPSQ